MAGEAVLPKGDGLDVDHPPESAATGQPGGCNLKGYAAFKRLPMEFLSELGLSDTSLSGRPAVCMPYRDADGNEVATRYRIALENGNGDRFRWKTGDRPLLYGLWRLQRDVPEITTNMRLFSALRETIAFSFCNNSISLSFFSIS